MTAHPDFPVTATAPCAHFETCGGCQLQHVDSEIYASWKEGVVKNSLERERVQPDAWLPSLFIPAGTRRRASFAAHRKGKDLQFGFHAYRSTEIINLTQCHLLTPHLDSIRSRLTHYLPGIIPDGVEVDIFIQEVGADIEILLTGPFADISNARMEAVARLVNEVGIARVAWQPKALSPAESILSLHPIKKNFGKLVVELPPGTFLQPSQEGEDALVKAVMAGFKGGKGKKFADLFSGCGTFTGHLLELGDVYAAETDPVAVQALKSAAKSHRGLTADRRNLFKEPVSLRELNAFSGLVFDPPRAGAKEQAEQIAKSKIPVVAAVSCNPQTFARDAKILLQGGYKLSNLQIVDQFIWSTHAELVGIFKKS